VHAELGKRLLWLWTAEVSQCNGVEEATWGSAWLAIDCSVTDKKKRSVDPGTAIEPQSNGAHVLDCKMRIFVQAATELTTAAFPEASRQRAHVRVQLEMSTACPPKGT